VLQVLNNQTALQLTQTAFKEFSYAEIQQFIAAAPDGGIEILAKALVSVEMARNGVEPITVLNMHPDDQVNYIFPKRQTCLLNTHDLIQIEHDKGKRLFFTQCFVYFKLAKKPFMAINSCKISSLNLE
jgi:hypothetical protein